jgi:CTP-dependent riboflavin kinase
LIGSTRVTKHTEFGSAREEYGGERDILLLPCDLASLDHRKAFLWTPTTAAGNRRDPWVVEIVADVNLRDHFGLQDGDLVEIRIPISGFSEMSTK